MVSKNTVKPTITKCKMERPHASVTSKNGHVSDASNRQVTQSATTGMKRKKNKPTTTDLATRSSDLKSKITTEIQTLENNIPVVKNSEQEYLDEYLRIFTKLKEIAKTSEDRYFDSPSTREIYALMTVYSQIRETIADVRNMSSMDDQAAMLVRQVIQPSISAIAQSLVDVMYHIRVLIREISKDDQVQYGIQKIDELMRDEGLVLQHQYQIIEERIFELLVQHR